MTSSQAARGVHAVPGGYGAVEGPSATTTVRWQKSSASGESGACVEAAGTEEQVLVRDSRNPLGPVLTFTRAGWAGFLGGVQGDEFHRCVGGGL